jgi:hypothetical protein
MDATSAETLRIRIESQNHWRQADAVVRGAQPATDPDGSHLEELRDGIRVYATREQERRVVDGRPARVTQRLTKRLVSGWWETVYEPESVEYFELESPLTDS